MFEQATKQSAGGNGGVKMEAPLLEAGGYPARLIRLVDLGLQPGSQQYPEPQYKMAFVFECLDEFMVDEEGKELLDQPRIFDYEVSYNPDGFMGDRSNIYKVIDALEGFEIPLADLLNKVCNINLIEKGTRADASKKYNKITGVGTMRAKDAAKYEGTTAISEMWVFSLSKNPSKEEFEKQSKRGGDYSHQAKIKANLELWSKNEELALALGLEKPPVVDHGANHDHSDEEVNQEAMDAMAGEPTEVETGAAPEAGDDPFA
ncbi:hypothetical protein [Vibrio phage vB_VpaM_VPs20]|uniref:Uncharacterized protein n=1 Tax=Vibrio phage vB_VpaM_VPs20 TaxID=2978980 RepID=A0A9X9NZV1_9CAUD|nr:hypothetical protein QNH06_gp05 [Vibrio phage vB_VpaM_VPs20]UYD72105.1 hypothetical protein [Vibrio phage vB_VpaM_VPs20]